MGRTKTTPAPKTFATVSEEVQRLAIRILRAGGDAGVTKVNLAKGLGNVTERTADRAIECLERQGARIDRPRRLTAKNHSLIHFRLLRGPRWDESLSPMAEAVFGLAELVAPKNLEVSRPLLVQFRVTADLLLTTEDLRTLHRMLGEEVPASLQGLEPVGLRPKRAVRKPAKVAAPKPAPAKKPSPAPVAKPKPRPVAPMSEADIRKALEALVAVPEPLTWVELHWRKWGRDYSARFLPLRLFERTRPKALILVGREEGRLTMTRIPVDMIRSVQPLQALDPKRGRGGIIK